MKFYYRYSKMSLSQYEVIGRKIPASTADSDAEPIYRMHLFAPTALVAKSRFWFVSSTRARPRTEEVLMVVLSKSNPNNNPFPSPPLSPPRSR